MKQKTFGKIKQVQKVDLTEQKELLKNNKKLNRKKNMSLVLRYNRAFLNYQKP